MLNGTGKIDCLDVNIYSLFFFRDIDGSLFPPNIKKTEDIYSYNADMCR
jgi:hypothetical protein